MRGEEQPLLKEGSIQDVHPTSSANNRALAEALQRAIYSKKEPVVPGNVSAHKTHNPRVSTVPGAIFNMSNSILGGGLSLLALPSAVAAAGPALFLVLLVGSGVATIMSAQLLAEAAEHAGVTEYDALGATALGKVGSTAVMVFIFLNNFGVCITFLQGFGDVVPELVQTAVAAHHRRHHPNNHTGNITHGLAEVGLGAAAADSYFGPFLSPSSNERLLPATPAAGDAFPYSSHPSTLMDPLDTTGLRSVLTLLLLVPLLPVMITLTRIEHLQSVSFVALVLARNSFFDRLFYIRG
jgi:hypothetical protein